MYIKYADIYCLLLWQFYAFFLPNFMLFPSGIRLHLFMCADCI